MNRRFLPLAPVPSSRWPRALGALAACGLVGSLASAQQQVTFSIADPGASIMTADCAGNPIFGASVLTPATANGHPVLGAPQPPCVAIPHTGGAAGTLGLMGGMAHPELDALSYGDDARLQPVNPPGRVWFSVDERARGLNFPPPYGPSVRSESTCGDHLASTFTDVGLPPLPAAWNVGPRPNTEVFDGDSLASCNGYSRPGLGVVEPNQPGLGLIGDDVDALDVGSPGNLVYFSLDAAFVDPCGGAGWGTAAFNGFAPGDILQKNLAGGPPLVWAPAAMLGLDWPGYGYDDLDALAVWDNGNGVYDPAQAPFDWATSGVDMVLFSVRRGSWVIGQPDSLLGQPIEEGDVLMPRLPGGATPFPAILISAEVLGLRTRRSGTAAQCTGTFYADELDALDVVKGVYDCNGNGIEDVLDIFAGTSADADANGIPDECGLASVYCTAKVNSQGCAPMVGYQGTPSVSAGSGFVIGASSVINNKPGLLFYGTNGPLAMPFQGGTLCVNPPLVRSGFLSSGGNPPPDDCSGAYSFDFNATIASGADPSLVQGQAVNLQIWQRDPNLPPPSNTGLTNAVKLVIGP